MTAPTVMNANRFEWERLVRRLILPPTVKLVALVLATYADPNGTRVRPGQDVVAAVTGCTERTVQRQFRLLTEMNLIELVRRGGGRGGKGKASEYRLTIPVDLLDRFPMLSPGDRGPIGLPVDNSESPDTQVSGQSARVTTNDPTPSVTSDRMTRHWASNDPTQLCPTTSHRPTTTETRPTGLRPNLSTAARARAAATTPILLDSGNKVSEFEAAS